MKATIIPYFLLFTWLNFSQVDFKGRVVNKSTLEPVKNVLITCKENGSWTFTNINGWFSIKLPEEKSIEIDLKHMTFVNKSVTVNSLDKKRVLIEIEEENLRLEEVVLFGEKKKYSEIIFKKEAIENVQAFTPLSVLEQLPGQSVSDFSLNSFKNIVFRTAEIGSSGGESYSNKAFGTAILVDDFAISNNENMQKWVPNYTGVFGSTYNQFGVNTSSSVYTNAGLGADLREISTENIAEIEVIQGIPDAKYGDLTSGLVRIETKAGVSPLSLRVSLKDGTTNLTLSKGLKLSDQLGTLNVSMSSLVSNSDPKDVVDEFSRINFNTKWSFQRKYFTNRMQFSYSSNFDDGWQNPDDVYETFIKNETKRFRLSNRFNYRLGGWLENLTISTAISYGKQHSVRRTKVNNGGEVVPISFISGIFEAPYTPVAYYSTREIIGKPLSINTNISVDKNIETTNNWVHNLSSGIVFNYSDNLGEGRVGTPETLDHIFAFTSSTSSRTGFRPYSFNENITNEKQFAMYFQNSISKNWKQKKLNASVGLRLDSQNGYKNLSPRVNTSFRFNNFLKLRGGFGLATKSPSLNSLYTGKQYYDQIIGDFRTSEYNVAYIRTIVKDEQNLDLKPTKSFNTELGLDLNLDFVNISLTGFYKRLTDGLTNMTVFNNAIVDDYAIVDNSPNEPTIEIIGEENMLYTDQKTINGLTSKDYGLEFQFNFKKIKALNLDVSINGLYAKTENFNTSNIYKSSTILSANETYGVFDKSFTTIKDLFRFGSFLKYHIPKIGLILNIRTEHFIFNRSYYGKDFTIYPVGYLDETYTYHSIPIENRTNTELYGHVFRDNPDTSINKARVTHNFHLRLSKEFINGFRLDFYANNFLNMRPTYLDGDNQLQTLSITPLSFGMNLNYKF